MQLSTAPAPLAATLTAAATAGGGAQTNFDLLGELVKCNGTVFAMLNRCVWCVSARARQRVRRIQRLVTACNGRILDHKTYTAFMQARGCVAQYPPHPTQPNPTHPTHPTPPHPGRGSMTGVSTVGAALPPSLPLPPLSLQWWRCPVSREMACCRCSKTCSGSAARRLLSCPV